MFETRCPYCPSTAGRCATTPSGRPITACASCNRAITELQTHTHTLFPIRAHDNPLPLVTPDLSPPSLSNPFSSSSDDPFHPTGFITAFSTFSLEPSPLLARSASSFSAHLAELERALDPDGAGTDPSGPNVPLDHLRAYLQILEVGSLLGLDHDIGDHAFQLFKDCASTTCLRNRNVEALATAALVQAIREAQEPRTLQEISAASNLPQKEIGKYIKILGESLQLSQPVNSNSIAVHMPRFCTLLQLNKSAQELAAHIGEVVVNKCFCTRRNPISISAAAIYLACQLEDKRKTQAEICKVTGLTEVTLRKVYKELLESWDDLLPPNYTPAVPPEKAFPMTVITSGRSSTPKFDKLDTTPKFDKIDTIPKFEKIDTTPKFDKIDTTPLTMQQFLERYSAIKTPFIDLNPPGTNYHVRVREGMASKSGSHDHSLQSREMMDLNMEAIWQRHTPLGIDALKSIREREAKVNQAMTFEESKSISDCMQKVLGTSCRTQTGEAPIFSNMYPLNDPLRVSHPPSVKSEKQQIDSDSVPELQAVRNQGGGDNADRCPDND